MSGRAREGATFDMDRFVCHSDPRTFRSKVYVAISRARSIAGLQIVNFHARNARVNPRALQFQEALIRSDRASGGVAAKTPLEVCAWLDLDLAQLAARVREKYYPGVGFAFLFPGVCR